MPIEPVEIEFLLKNLNFGQETKKMKDEISGVSSSVTGVDQSFANMTGNLKRQLEQQRQLMREIGGDIRKLQNDLNNASTPQQKKDIGSELKAAKSALIEENGRLIAMQRQQIEMNGKEESTIDKLTGKFGKWAIGLFSVGVAMKAGKEIMESTETTSNKLEHAIASAEAAVGYFFKTIATGDWSNFFDGLKTATDGAVEFTEAMNRVDNLTNQDRIATAEIDKKIASEREKTYDRGKANDKERLSAYDEMIRLTEEKYSKLIETAEVKRNALLTKASTDTGGKVSTEEINQFISQFRSLEEGIKLGEEYNKQMMVVRSLEDKVNQSRSRGITNDLITPQFETAKKQLAEMGEAGKLAGEQVEHIGRITFPVRDELSKAISDVVRLTAEQEQGNTFIKRSRGALQTKLKTDAEETAKKQKEAAELENKIKSTKEEMKKTSGKELDDLAVKLNLLEKEKSLMDGIAESALSVARNRAMPTKGATTAIGAIDEMKKATGLDFSKAGKTPKVVALEVDKLNKKVADDKKKLDKEALEKLEKEARLREEIVGYALQLVDALRRGMDLTEGQSAALDGAMDAVSALGEGDYIGAAISGFTTAIGAVMDTSGIEEKLSRPWIEFENWVSRSNNVLERYIKLRDEAIGSERYTASDQAIKEAESIKAEAESKLNDMKLSWTFKDSGWGNEPYKNIDRAIDDLQRKLGGGLKMEGDEKEWGIAGAWKSVKQVVSYELEQMTKDTNGNFSLDKLRKLIADGTVADEAVVQAVSDYDANMDKLITLQKEKQQLLTDTMASSIADSIIEGFKNGYDSAADFASNFEDLMIDAILNSLKIKTLEEPLKKWYDQFSNDMESGGGLDQLEKDKLNALYNDIIEKGKAATDAAFLAAGVNIQDSAKSTALTGITASLTEDTGSMIVGLATGIRIDLKEILIIAASGQDDVAKNLLYMKEVAENSRHLPRLKAIEEGIGEMNKTLKEKL